ncbi:MAG: hypothetical protein M3217_12820, partial [Actinomycetota bacterium]|nr:hypothetical protein [Actinomycetota bacterium]
SWSDPEPATPPPSLDEIWASPARRDPAPPAPPADDVQWHEPAAGPAAPPGEREEASGRPSRRANADVPDEAFHGPRRRRWFRRRR